MLLRQHVADTDEAEFDKFFTSCNNYCEATADKHMLSETGTLFTWQRIETVENEYLLSLSFKREMELTSNMRKTYPFKKSQCQIWY